jgi:GMP synthase (glutamine-hydrolysing)
MGSRYLCPGSRRQPLILLQDMAWILKGTVAKCDRREYGFAHLQIVEVGQDGNPTVDALFEGLGDNMQVLPCH